MVSILHKSALKKKTTEIAVTKDDSYTPTSADRTVTAK